MRKYGKYEKKYRRSWEDLPQFKGWLVQNTDANNFHQEAYCKLCEVGLRAQKFDLEKHGKTKNHRDNASKLVKQKTLETCRITVVSDASKRTDLKLAVYVATHSVVRSIDHLNDVLRDLGKNSMLESLRLHRTKCSKLITNVISPALLVGTVDDVGDNPYSLVIDESTDISTQKYMAVCIRYFSTSKTHIVTAFLGIVQITDMTANALYENLTEYLSKIKLPIKNLIGIGTDGASNLCGKNHSLYTLLKGQVPLPNLQIVRCVCHSLHLCSSKASETLPCSLEYLVRESRNWFAHSVLRRRDYKDLYNLINDTNKAFLNLVQLSATRWLAWEGAVKRVLYQWLELKTHFKGMAVSDNKCYTAKTLSSMYKDPTNHLYLIFLKSVLHDVNEANILFQSTQEEITKLYETLSSLMLSVASRIIRPVFMDEAQKDFEYIEKTLQNELALQPAHELDLGIEFKNATAVYNLKPEVLLDIKVRCRQYLIVVLSELLKRLPSNMSILKSLAKLSPEIILSTVRKIDIKELPLTLLDNSIDISVVEGQLRKIPFVDWADHFTDEVRANTTLFWANVYVSQTGTNTYPFKELAGFALKLLSLPLSNAVVERVSSIMNAVKTKARNKMSYEMLDAILRIRTHFHTSNTCCKSFEPSPMMYEKLNSKMYDLKPSAAESSQGTSKQNDAAEPADDLIETLTLFADDDA